VPFEERGRRLDEYLAVLAVIAKGEHPVAFDGKYVRFGGATFYPRPANVRLWITGDSEPALQRVVRWGSGWFSSWWPTRAAYEQLVARLDDLARETGRPPATIERASDPFVCVADTREAALSICGETLRRRYGSLERALVISAVGSPADVSDQLRALMRSGCTYFELRFICHDMDSYLEMIERVAREVVPGLRT
jgi:alkanesulfonate monooxygenase SsuD/methylene tetrahydromethanopterin reductase-like flavin-dependent oxidoreductase (luciferase family)